MKMLVLAGGLGVRLRSVVSDVPKPLAPVGQMPFLHYQVEHWIAQGIRSFVFLLQHKANLIDCFIEERRSTLLANCEIKSIIEPEPLDTGGAVANAVTQLGIEGDFVLANADTWLGSGVQELMSMGSDAIVVVRRKDVSRYGMVEIDDIGFVCGFREKVERGEPGWVNAGMGVFRAQHFKGWDGRRFSLEKDVFPKLYRAKKLRALLLESDFIDIGVPADYLKFCRWQVGGREGSLCN